MTQKIGKDGRSQQQRASLRVCMSCEWIYKGSISGCPKCSWPSYGARFVYGNMAYKYAKTQRRWMDKKMFAYQMELMKEIRYGQDNHRT